MRTVISLFALLAAFACMSGTATAQVATQQWISLYSAYLPTKLCEKQQYFRQCFAISGQQCEQAATSATSKCVDDIRDQMPKALETRAQGVKWGRRIGIFVGTAVEKSMASKKKSTARCHDASAWTK